jgi:hypothetical protein
VQKKSLGGWMLMGLVLGCATATPPQQAPGATAQSAQSAQKEEKVAAADSEQDPDRTLICESIPVTGSHIPRKKCRTLRQVEQEREQAQKALQDADKVNRDWNR